MTRDSLLEALLFSASGALSVTTLAKILDVPPDGVQAIAQDLREKLAGRGIALMESSEGYELRTIPEAFDVVKKLRDLELTADLGRASLETLAIVLYKKGTTKRDIDHIRGVNSSTSLRTLLLRGLVHKSEYESDKRQSFYTATADALAHLGSAKSEELPRFEEFAQALSGKSAVVEEGTEPSI